MWGDCELAVALLVDMGSGPFWTGSTRVRAAFVRIKKQDGLQVRALLKREDLVKACLVKEVHDLLLRVSDAHAALLGHALLQG